MAQKKTGIPGIYPQTYLLFILCLVFVEITYNNYVVKHVAHDHAIGYKLALNYAQQIQQNVTHAISTVDMIEGFLKYADYDTASFSQWAPLVKSAVPSASVVQLAPDGIVRNIYPMAGNEKAVGHDLLRDKARKRGAERAVVSRETVFVGPLRLIQNNKLAVIARKPVFRESDDSFWGFSIVLVHLEEMLRGEIEKISHPEYAIQIYGEDPDAGSAPLLFTTEKELREGDWDIVIPIAVPMGEWSIRMEHFGNKEFWAHSWYVHLLLLTISVLVAVLFNQLKRYRDRIIEEKEMALKEVDTLKGFIPICASCKNIRNDAGYWQKVEAYITSHSEAEFSHSICPDCQKKLYPEIFGENQGGEVKPDE